MRVTNGMMINNLLGNLNDSKDRLDKYNRQLSTGKKFNMPSQDPTGTVRSMDLNSTISNSEQYIDNIDQAINWVAATDDALGNAGEILQQSRELAVYGANDSLSSTDRNAVADEVEKLRNNLVQIANAKQGGKYLFVGQHTLNQAYKKEAEVASSASGITTASIEEKSEFTVGDYTVEFDSTGTEATLMDADGNGVDTVTGLTNTTAETITFSDTEGNTLEVEKDNSDMSNAVEDVTVSFNYQGDENKLTKEIAKGVEMGINQSGKHFEETLQELGVLVKNLRNDETEAISEDRIGNLDQRIDKVLSMRSETGAKQNRLELTKSRLEDDKIKFKKLLSQNEDVNIAETIMNLKMSENVHRAALSSGARIIQPSLMQFLK